MTVGQEKISHRLVISYKNNSLPGVWPGGDYKNYIRLYTNSGSRAINQPVLVSAGGKEEFLTFEESQEKGKKVFGSLLLVPAGETRQFIATWESLVGLETEQGKSGSLMFYWQKQAGVGSDLATIKLNLPTAGTGGVVSAFPMPTLTQTNTIEYNTSLARDFVTNLIWQHKNTN